MNNKTLFPKILSVSLLAIVAGAIFWACQKEKFPEDIPDAQIVASLEMEEYIVAGYELRSALNEMQQELKKIDFSKLEFVRDAEGKLVMHLPVQCRGFEVKLKAFNEKKYKLLQKFPQLSSFASNRRMKIIGTCIQNSVPVSTTLLNMGIDICISTKRPGMETFDDSMLFLSEWVGNNPHYVEAVIIVYRDGSSCIYIDPTNTYKSSTYPPLQHVNGTDLFYYRDGGSDSPILFIGHTHLSGGEPSAKDCETAIDGLREAVL